MKKNFLNFFLFATFMLYDFVAFAQAGPGDDDDDGGLEGDDPAPVPINGKLIWLAIIGILFAVYVYRSNRQSKKA